MMVKEAMCQNTLSCFGCCQESGNVDMFSHEVRSDQEQEIQEPSDEI